MQAVCSASRIPRTSVGRLRIDCRESDGPDRCHQCRGYKCCFSKTDSTAVYWKCHLCLSVNPTDKSNPYARAKDIDKSKLIFYDSESSSVAEKASVEYLVSGLYFPRKYTPRQLFLVDMTRYAMNAGVTEFVLEMILNGAPLLYQKSSLYRIGLATFNEENVTFYRFISAEKFERRIIGHLEEPFAALTGDELLYSSEDEGLHKLKTLADYLRSVINDPEPVSVSQQRQQQRMKLNSAHVAICSGYKALKGFGGKLTVFTTSLSNIGKGKLFNRELATNKPMDSNAKSPPVYGSSSEADIYNPAYGGTASGMGSDEAAVKSRNYFGYLKRKFAEQIVSLDCFALSDEFIDLACLNQIVVESNGKAFYYPTAAYRDQQAMAHMKVVFYRRLCEECALDVVLKVRTSVGIEVKGFFAKGHQLSHFNSTDFSYTSSLEKYFATFGYTDNIAVELSRNRFALEKPEHEFMYLQVAVLHTDLQGQRKLRIHNLQVRLTESIDAVFKAADVETVGNFWYKRSCHDLISREGQAVRKLQDVRNSLTTKTINTLSGYRRFCAKNPNPGQLILPESLKLLPLYVLGMFKTKILRDNKPDNFNNYLKLMKQVPLVNESNTIIFRDHYIMRQLIRADDRNAAFNDGLSCSTAEFLREIYPRLVNLLDVCFEKEEDFIPVTLPPNSMSVLEDGIYFLESPSASILYIGSEVDELLLESMGISGQNIQEGKLPLLTNEDIAGNDVLSLFQQSLVKTTEEAGGRLEMIVLRDYLKAFSSNGGSGTLRDVRGMVLYLILVLSGLDHLTLLLPALSSASLSLEALNSMLQAVRVVYAADEESCFFVELFKRKLVEEKQSNMLNMFSYEDYLCKMHTMIGEEMRRV